MAGCNASLWLAATRIRNGILFASLGHAFLILAPVGIVWIMFVLTCGSLNWGVVHKFRRSRLSLPKRVIFCFWSGVPVTRCCVSAPSFSGVEHWAVPFSRSVPVRLLPPTCKKMHHDCLCTMLLLVIYSNIK